MGRITRSVVQNPSYPEQKPLGALAGALFSRCCELFVLVKRRVIVRILEAQLLLEERPPPGPLHCTDPWTHETSVFPAMVVVVWAKIERRFHTRPEAVVGAVWLMGWLPVGDAHQNIQTNVPDRNLHRSC